jgi:hypothetical protein
MADANTTVHPLYAAFDPESLDSNNVTLCADCAKHPSLKRFVEIDSVEGPVCGVCKEVSYVYPACNPSRKEDLTNLIKALIRFYYNEHEYNPHWGADDEPEGLLTEANPILETVSVPGRTRSPDRTSEFLYALLSARPYPPVDEGISIYAGHDEGVRGMNFALKDTPSLILMTYLKRLAIENHFDIEPDLLTLADKFAERLTHIVPVGTVYFRARIGVVARFLDQSRSGWHRPVVRQPFSGAALGAPPPQIATAGRLNRAGVAFLYLASDAATAAAEVRPHPGHFLSVGGFESLRDLKIASFKADIMHFAKNEFDLELFHFIHSTDERMALPVVPGETRRYSITQLIAECLRQKGFDGVLFRSSVGEGQNLCVFRPELFGPVDGSAVVQEVKSLSYRLEASPMIRERNVDHDPLEDG